MKSFQIWKDFCVVAEILLTERVDHCVGDRKVRTIGYYCAIPFLLNSIVQPQSLTSCFHTTKEYFEMTL